MAASDHLHPDQINYRITRNLPGSGRGEIAHAVYAHHPEHGVIGMLKIGNDNWRRGTRYPSPPPEEKNAGGRGLGVELVHVLPEHQKQGIGSAMYNIATRELGYAPIHDMTRSPAGQAFAKSVARGTQNITGGHIPGGDSIPYKSPSWGVTPGEPNEVNKRQARNYEHGKDVDPTWAKALTPVQQPAPSRKGQPKQGELFSGKDYYVKPPKKENSGKFKSRKMSLEGRRV